MTSRHGASAEGDALLGTAGVPGVVRLAGDAGAWNRMLAILCQSLEDRRDLLVEAPRVEWQMGDACVPMRVTLPGTGALGIIEPAARSVASRCELRWDLVTRLADRGSVTLPALLREEWALRFPGAMRWRIVRGAVHAVVSPDYTRMDDIPLLRSLEDGFRAASLFPTRMLRDATRTRVEFVGPAIPGSRYRPGVVLGNSETGDGSAALMPALVRGAGSARGAVATAWSSALAVRARHTVADPAALVHRMIAQLPALLAEAEREIRRWDSVRANVLTPEIVGGLGRVLADAVGASSAHSIIAGWPTHPEVQRTPTALYRQVAEATRDRSPWHQVGTDVLLPALTAIR